MALLIILVLKGDRELEVHTVTYGPGIDQSQHAKSVSHIIKHFIASFAIILSLKITFLIPPFNYTFNSGK